MYEITFHYHPRNEDGKYNTSETLTFTKNLGKKKDEVQLEKVAVLVMGELARRDIWIINVEIFEYAKREINFKETKGGVILKNKKFQFDQLHGELISEDVVEQQQQQQVVQQPQPQQVTQLAKQSSPLRNEVFRPNPQDLAILQKQGVRLTVNKPYPIMKELVRGESQPLSYVVIDDTGKMIEISSFFFEPVRRGLVGDTGISPRNEGRLSYMSNSGDTGLASMIAAQDAAIARGRI